MRVLGLAVLAGAFFVAAGCGGAKEGDALSEAGLGFGTGGVSPLVVGHEYALLFIPTANESDEPVTLERVEVRGVSGEQAAKVVGVDVQVRDLRGGSYVRGGLTEVVSKPRRDCRDRRTFVPVEGHVVKPGDDPLLAVRVRALAPGVFRSASLRVFYRQGGDRRYQDMGFRTRLGVKRAQDLSSEGESLPCAHVTSTPSAR